MSAAVATVVTAEDDRRECIVGFMSGYGGNTPGYHLREHLTEQGHTPTIRRDMRWLTSHGFVESVRGRGYRFTTTGRAWAATKYGYDWLIGGSK